MIGAEGLILDPIHAPLQRSARRGGGGDGGGGGGGGGDGDARQARLRVLHIVHNAYITPKHPAAIMALVSLAYQRGGRGEICRVDTWSSETRKSV